VIINLNLLNILCFVYEGVGIDTSKEVLEVNVERTKCCCLITRMQFKIMM
jgi:hypothetical protein